MKSFGEDLYIIQAAVTGVVKIGRTKDIERRLNELQTGNPYTLKVILLVPKEGPTEFYIHGRLRSYRIRWRGEWFREEGLSELPDRLYEMLDLETQDWWQDPKYL